MLTTNNKFNYVNRKGFHYITVQIICDSHLALLNLVAGDLEEHTHASTVQYSSVSVCLQEGAAEDGWLIGECCNMFKMLLLGVSTVIKTCLICR